MVQILYIRNICLLLLASFLFSCSNKNERLDKKLISEFTINAIRDELIDLNRNKSYLAFVVYVQKTYNESVYSIYPVSKKEYLPKETPFYFTELLNCPVIFYTGLESFFVLDSLDYKDYQGFLDKYEISKAKSAPKGLYNPPMVHLLIKEDSAWVDSSAIYHDFLHGSLLPKEIEYVPPSIF